MKFKALLPMKANSERVPNKNMRLFNGFPLYHAVMKILLSSKFIEYVVINTDSDYIAKDAKTSFGEKVKIFKRPKEIQGDFVSMNDIIDYDLSVVNGDYFIQTHSTNPLLSLSTLEEAIEKYISLFKKYDSLFSVTKVQKRFYDINGKPINHNLSEMLRTQDLEPFFEENSCFYIFSRDSFYRAGKRRIGLKPYLFIMNKLESIDIDDPEDFLLAELLYKNRSRL